MHLTKRIVLIASLAGAAGLFVACRGSITVANRDLERAKQSWAANRPPSYDLTIEPSCFCAFEIPNAGPVIVAVRNGTVQSRTYVKTGTSVGDRYAGLYPSVDQLFVTIEDAVAKMADRLEVFYDPTYGYPVNVAIDFKYLVADDELFYHVTGFAVR
jgi:hypothetical protein